MPGIAARSRGKRAGRSAGAAAVELAIVLPMLLLCMLGLIAFARLVWIRSTLDYAVQSAARCGALGAAACLTADQIKSYAAAQAPGLALTPADVTVATPACGVSVSATVPFVLSVPALSQTSLSLRASACFPRAG